MMRYEKAWSLARAICRGIKSPHDVETVVVGSLRRGEKQVGDIDILVVSPRIRSDVFSDLLIESRAIDGYSVLSCGPRRCCLLLRVGAADIRCDLFYATRRELPFALLHHTGSREYLMRMRYIAKMKGYILNQYGLYHRDSREQVRGKFIDEKDVMLFLGMREREPSMRHR